MRRFEMVLPGTVDECLRVLAERGPDAKLVAGGTDLLPQMKNGLLQARAAWWTCAAWRRSSRSSARRRAPDRGGGHRAGAGAGPAGAVEAIRRWRRAAALVGSVQIRNLATVGGNLCNAAPSADMAPPLDRARGRGGHRGPRGTRRVPLTAFFSGVRRTVLAPDELLVELVGPGAGAAQRGQLPAPHASPRAGHRGGRRRLPAHAGGRRLREGADRAGGGGPDARPGDGGRAGARGPAGDPGPDRPRRRRWRSGRPGRSATSAGRRTSAATWSAS